MKNIYLDIALIILGGAIGGGFVLFLITFCVVIGGCPGFTTEKAVEIFSEPMAIIIGLSSLLISVGIFFALLFYRRYTYVDESLFKLSIRGQRVPRKCRICGKHPYSQKVHAKKVHHLDITILEEHFDDCGCDLCYERKTNWKQYGS